MSSNSYRNIPLPSYVIEEDKLRGNLRNIAYIADAAGVEFILAFKAFALWKTFPIFREYIKHTTASSLYEAKLAYEEFGSKAHTYSPAYEKGTFPEIVKYSSHITFNTLTQYARFYPDVQESGEEVSCGIRINPEYSEIKTELYNPCAPGSRFGILASQLPATLPVGIEGFHCHNHCESSSQAFEHSLHHVEEKFGKWFGQIKWINFGGGHLVNRDDYDCEHLITTLRAFRQRYPHLKVILEPGSAFAWQTGPLVAEVVDIVENDGIKTAILNVSFTCHMPDCLEMPYHPEVRGAVVMAGDDALGHEREWNVYRLGGNSCLSGDYMGYWRFDKELVLGDTIIFEDMIHYTSVKTNMFNGIHHPSFVMQHSDGRMEILRTFSYEDYKNRMD